MTQTTLDSTALDRCYSDFCHRAGALSPEVQALVLARFSLLAISALGDEPRVRALIDAALDGMDSYQPIPKI